MLLGIVASERLAVIKALIRDAIRECYAIITYCHIRRMIGTKC